MPEGTEQPSGPVFHDAVRLLVDPEGTDCAGPTFTTILAELARVRESVEIHMFVWRNDEVGNAVARALRDAADRGVEFHLKKDRSAIMFERIEMNRKSLFHTPLPWYQRLYLRLIRPTFPNTFVADDRDNQLGDDLMAHPDGAIEWVSHTHTKYYVFDEEVMLTGSINVEDRHRNYYDYMVELRDPALIEHFRQRQTGAAPMDPTRSVEFVLNRVDANGGKAFEIKPLLLELMAAATDSIYVEMAYLGDEAITAALIAAANRGVEVTLFISRAANVGNDLNYAVLHEIMAESPVRVFLSEVMIHAKLYLFDDKITCFGSANASVFSMQKAVELNLLIQDQPEFLRELRGLIDRRLATGREVRNPGELGSYRSWLAYLQQLQQKLC